MKTKAKAWAAGIGSVLTVFIAVYADNVLNTEETVSLISAAVAAVGTIYAVYRVPNKDIQV